MTSKSDFHTWRCMCGETETQIDKVNCNKCGKQRWAQLGISRLEATGIVAAIYPSVEVA